MATRKMAVHAPPHALRTTPEEPLDAAQLGDLIGYQLAQATIVTSRVFQTQVGKPQDLNPVEYTLLALIHANPGVSPTQLCKALGISKPYVTAGLDKLRTRGLVIRATNPNDQRAHQLSVTSVGEQLVPQLTAELQAGELAALSRLSFTERTMLTELLHKLAQARN